MPSRLAKVLYVLPKDGKPSTGDWLVLKKGDTVVTAEGVTATVVDPAGDTVTLARADGTRFRLSVEEVDRVKRGSKLVHVATFPPPSTPRLAQKPSPPRYLPKLRRGRAVKLTRDEAETWLRDEGRDVHVLLGPSVFDVIDQIEKRLAKLFVPGLNYDMDVDGKLAVEQGGRRFTLHDREGLRRLAREEAMHLAAEWGQSFRETLVTEVAIDTTEAYGPTFWSRGLVCVEVQDVTFEDEHLLPSCAWRTTEFPIAKLDALRAA